KQITDLIEQVIKSREEEENFLTRIRIPVNFKDIVRLAYGAVGIYRRQVNILLTDAKYLLEQIKGTKLVFEFSSEKSVVVRQSHALIHRQRKRVITQKSTVTVSKRPRLCEQDLLGKSSRRYYANLFSECLDVPQIESSQEITQDLQVEETIETPRMCSISTSYQAITITEEFSFQEDHTFMCPSDGFGETNPDLSIFEELFSRDRPSKYLLFSVKRPSICLNSTEILPNKMPRLEESVEKTIDSSSDNAIITTNSSNSVDAVEETNAIVCEPLIPVLTSPLPTCFDFKKDKKLKKGKLIVDKCIQYSKESLLQHRQKYMNNCNARKIIVNAKQIRSADDLLTKLNKNSIFPDFLSQIPICLDEDHKEDESEATLRSIFAEDFSTDLAKDILGMDLNHLDPIIQNEPVKVEEFNLNELNNNHNLEQAPLNPSSPTPEEQNNNISELDVMMDLLTIWRKNPETKEIDAMDYIKLFPDRLTVSMVFSHLLSLVKKKLLTISKKPNSIEMDQISLGKESINLIQDIAVDAGL
ncbi:hypothetical protein KR026_005406, partial [Drosophila bipectinata]